MERSWESATVAKVIQSLGSGGRGGSRPLLGLTESGDTVHLKFQLNPQSTMSLVNDWIGTHLGYALGVPVPTPQLVTVQFSDLATFPELRSRRWRPGIQFATHWVPACRPLTLPVRNETVANRDQVPLVLLFELWLDNHDLKPEHLHLYSQSGQTYLLVTDHGFIFPDGPHWTPRGLKTHRRQLPTRSIYHQLLTGFSHHFTFDAALSRLHTVSQSDLTSLVSSVPSEWGLSIARQRAVVDFLMERLDHLTVMIDHLTHASDSSGLI